MSPTVVTLILTAGAVPGLVAGIRIGRHVERALWHADNARLHAHFLSGAVREMAKPVMVGLLLLTLALAVVVWG